MAGTEDRYEKLGDDHESEREQQPTVAPAAEHQDDASLQEVLDEGNRAGSGDAPQPG